MKDQVICQYPFDENIISLALHPIKPHVAVCVKDKIHLWDYEKKCSSYCIVDNENTDQMRAVLFSLDGRKMFYAHAQNNIRVPNVNIFASAFICTLSYRTNLDRFEKITTQKLPFSMILYNNGGIDFDESGKLLLATVKIKPRPKSPSSVNYRYLSKLTSFGLRHPKRYNSTSCPPENDNQAAVCLVDLSDRWFGRILHQYTLQSIIYNNI